MKHLIFVARNLSVKDDSKLVEDIIDFIGNHLLMCGGGTAKRMERSEVLERRRH